MNKNISKISLCVSTILLYTTIGFASQDDKKEPQNISATSIAVQYLPLLDIVNLSDTYIKTSPQRDQYKKGMKKHFSGNKKFSKRFLESIDKQEKMVDSLYKITSDLLFAKIDISNYLKNLLKARMSFLKKRTQDIMNYWKGGYEKEEASFYPPIDLVIFNWLMEYERYKEYRSENQGCRNDINMRYTILQSLIVESLKLCSLDELDEGTLWFLRVSIQLHPILKNNTDDENIYRIDAASGYAVAIPFIEPF